MAQLHQCQDVFNVSDGDMVSVHVDGLRKITFHNVLIRVKANFVLEFHVDTDEANVSLLKTGDTVEIVNETAFKPE